MKHLKIFSFALLTLLAFVSGCKKEGIGGNAEVAFTVEHHEDMIPYATVYIKYGAKEFPGATTSVYDDSVLTDATSHGHFHELVKGDYYLYGVGYDSAVSEIVKGGIGLSLDAKDALETTVPVTE
ncbi:MAG: hypothetical protein RLZZ519_2176 [Bacteroidota bacterium]|jgi:hypothetical protein